MKCNNCNREMNQHDEFCGACGSGLVVSPATAPNSCPVCMNEIAPNQTHCKKCGSSKTLFVDREPTKELASESEKSTLPGIILTFIGLAVLIFAFVNYQSTGETLRTSGTDVALGLIHVLSFPIGIVGLIVLIVGLYSLRDTSD